MEIKKKERKESEHPLSVLIPYSSAEVVEKYIGNGFYHKNSLQMIFTIKIHCKWFLLENYMRNSFYLKNILEIVFTKNSLQMVFTIKIHSKCYLQ